MTTKKKFLFGLGLTIFAGLFLTGCTAGDPQYTVHNPANFWHGIWHGMISVVVFIINLFDGQLGLYETHNNGAWYNFGFLLSIICVWGGTKMRSKRKSRKARDKEWAAVGEKIERKVLQECKAWAEASEGEQEEQEWDELKDKVKTKLKRKLKQWADDDDTREKGAEKNTH